MFESPHKLHRLATEKAAQYRHEADIARLLAESTANPGWRWRLGETLLALATRLSPAHRTLLRDRGENAREAARPQESGTLLRDLGNCLRETPLSDSNASA